MSEDKQSLSDLLEEKSRQYLMLNGLVADIEHWCRATSWTVSEAAYLISGIDPEVLAKGSSRLSAAYAQSLTCFTQAKKNLALLQRAKIDGNLLERNTPLTTLLECGRMQITVPLGLMEAVHAHSEHRIALDDQREEIVAKIAADRVAKTIQAEPVKRQDPKFVHNRLTSTFGYLPALEEILAEACANGNPIPKPEEVWVLLIAKNPSLVEFNTENKTLTYRKQDSTRSQPVDLKAISLAIRKRTSLTP